MMYYFKKINNEDWDMLLEWRNDSITRVMSLNENLISKESHYEYMNKLTSDVSQEQFIFIHNNNKIGTIKESKLNDKSVLSYTINPEFRGHGYGRLMMYLFLFDKKGIFECEIKPDNIGSIKMCLWNNFKLVHSTDRINTYQIHK